MARRSIIYIDGMNLYNGAIKGGPHKWLDIERYFRLLRNADDIQKIRYFTTRIRGPRRPIQETYLRALSTLPLVDIVEGKFKMKEVHCGYRKCTFQGDRIFRVPEEKRTDVNIALHMLDDAYNDRSDILVVVSGDSDLVPPVDMVKTLFPEKKIIVYVPARTPERGAATELRSAADEDRTLPQAILKVAQFPREVPDGSGGYIDKPLGW